MHQISLIQSNRAHLTGDQRSAWTRRGFLILKSHLSSAEVRRLEVEPVPDDGAAAYEAVVNALIDPVGEILETDPILLTLRRGVTERFGLDALDAASGPVVGGVTALVMLKPSPAWEHSLFACSHLISPDGSQTDRGAQMFRLSEEIRERGLRRETLTLAPGDVWLRHPRLMRGVQRRSGPDERPSWLTAVFARIEDLPRARTFDGLKLRERSARPLSRPSEQDSCAPDCLSTGDEASGSHSWRTTAAAPHRNAS